MATTDNRATQDAPAPAPACGNCEAPLHGEYCHACGQSAHNPLRSVRHAVEDVFESFWHLDGRVFRTLRDLMVPGRVACNFLAGRRARYVAPLRLMVVLSLITFFVAHFVMQASPNAVKINTGGATGDATDAEAAIARARSVEDVLRQRQKALAVIDEAEEGAAAVPLMKVPLQRARENIERTSAERIRELGGVPPPPSSGKPDAASTPAEGEWDPQRTKVDIELLPDAVNAWLTDNVRRGMVNAKSAEKEPQRIVDAWLKALPTALFLMVPVFALMLKLAYVLSGRLYLEHLAVALYSHAFLLLMLLGLFVLALIGQAVESAAVEVVLGLAATAIWLWAPVYLLIAQKRIYGQGWPLTLLKYVVIGTVYMLLVSTTIAVSLLVGIVRM